ncbi:MAG: HAD-IIIA family hydrolase [Stomatobaculum sp.]
MHAVIMAGGKGTRLAALTKGELPKPMVPLLGQPLLEWQLEQLRRYGVDRVTMVVGHLKEKITGYFGDGSAFHLKIDYVEETEPLGTAGAFPLLAEKISAPYFLLVFGDVLFDIDLRRMERCFLEKDAEALLFAHPNAHPFDSDLIAADADGRVSAFDSKHNVRDYWYDNCVNAGIYMLKRDILARVPRAVKTDFEKELLAPMAARGERVFAYRSPEYVKDVGTMERIEKAAEDIRSGFIAKRNLQYPQKAVFLDRDGVINALNGFVRTAEELRLLPGAAEALGLLNSSEYLAIVVTNQPVIARGETSPEELEMIFRKMKTLLGRAGSFVDDIFFCPHHPDRGFPGEREEYKIVCDCRKPNTGMLRAAAEKYHIDLAASWVIGDSTPDLELGRRGGCRTALVETGEAGKDGKYSDQSDIKAEDLLAAVREILRREALSDPAAAGAAGED